MKINEYGQVSITEQEAFDSLYRGTITNVENVYIDDKDIIEAYNSSVKTNADRIPLLSLPEDLTDISKEFFDESNQCNWFMPDNYCPNLVEMLYGMCTTEEQTNRVTQELELFIQHKMFDLLFYLKYLVDTLRANNVLWGVGRGSSVASYVLFLIGVHKIDSIKYSLDIKEFLK